MEKKYKLRQSAREDIKKIGRYTLKKYGMAKRNEYLLGLESQFESIAEMPLKARQRNDIREGYYSSSYKRHVIFFCIHNEYIEIMGVLHKRMLPEGHLLPDSISRVSLVA